MADKYSTSRPVVVVPSGGHPCVQVDSHGAVIGDATRVISTARPVISCNSSGVPLDDSTKKFSVAQNITIGSTGRPIVRVQADGTAIDTSLAGSASFDLTSYYAAMSVQPSADEKTLMQTAVDNLKAAGIMSKLRAFYLAVHDEQAARINVMNPSEVATVHGSPNFTADGGWKGNFSDGYLDSGIADNNAAPLAQNAGTLFAYVNVQPSGFGAILGLSASNATRLTGGPGTAPSGRIHNSTASTGTTANSFGLIAAVRTSSTNLKLYRNGTSEAITTTPAASAPVTDTFTLFKNSATFGDPQVPVWGFGDQLNDADNATLYTEIFNFLDPQGAS